MQLLMPTRNEAAVYFEQHIDAGPALAFLKQWNDEHETKLGMFHLVLHAIVQTLAARPRLNRFSMGGRLYQRRGIWLSFSAKQSMSDDAPMFVVKKEFDPTQSVAQVAEHARSGVVEGRSGKPSHVDKEIGLFLKLPLFILAPLVRLVSWLDRRNLVPFAFFRHDPLYASVFVANLGSIKLDAAFHHHYEYGNIPIFVTIGKLQRMPFVTDDGSVGVRDELLLRWTFDERIEDGLYAARSLELVRERLEHPTD